MLSVEDILNIETIKEINKNINDVLQEDFKRVLLDFVLTCVLFDKVEEKRKCGAYRITDIIPFNHSLTEINDYNRIFDNALNDKELFILFRNLCNDNTDYRFYPTYPDYKNNDGNLSPLFYYKDYSNTEDTYLDVPIYYNVLHVIKDKTPLTGTYFINPYVCASDEYDKEEIIKYYQYNENKLFSLLSELSRAENKLITENINDFNTTMDLINDISLIKVHAVYLISSIRKEEDTKEDTK